MSSAGELRDTLEGLALIGRLLAAAALRGALEALQRRLWPSTYHADTEALLRRWERQTWQS